MNDNAILIVDDDPYLCTLLTNVLKRHHFYIECAYTWTEASIKINELDPFMILLDHNLPDGKGLNLISNIKKKHKRKVIVMSADPSPMVKTLALKRGADDYIEKPFKAEEISSLVLGHKD